jgi:hypothetical protein
MMRDMPRPTESSTQEQSITHTVLLDARLPQVKEPTESRSARAGSCPATPTGAWFDAENDGVTLLAYFLLSPARIRRSLSPASSRSPKSAVMPRTLIGSVSL